MLVSTFFRQHWLAVVCILISVILFTNALPYWLPHTILNPSHKVVHPPQITVQPKKPLSTYALFGKSNEKTQADIADTQLNISLVGILNASEKKDSQALIKIDGGNEKLYLINDKINSNTLLWEVRTHSVLLKRNGQIEKLSLPKTDFKDIKVPITHDK